MSAGEALSARKEALFAKASDGTLIDAVRWLEGTEFGSGERLACAWACDELERRHPEVEPVMEAWVEAMDDRSYGSVLLGALESLARPVEPGKACASCGSAASVYVMGPRSGDWADFYCGGCEQAATVALGPGALVERLAVLG